MSKIIIRLLVFIVDDFGGERLLNKVIIFVFFTHKKYYCSFIKTNILKIQPLS